MVFVGPSIASSIAGAAQAERVAAREARKSEERERPGRTRRQADSAEIDSPVDETEETEAVRNAKGNAQEETHGDREERAYYEPGGASAPKRPPTIDLEG